ncbi:lipid phosphate phosphohydrolase 1 [Culex quinquefasciatus]|uniref:Lipid phosphate phosphohydrolase 1 n=1 Tax=Culex quinquefasciatus TaxID=7176 RepID=B0WZ11_CULQU|nr:putative phosphatidate phosphatase [Culex quinquefasciatus]EDS37325.1 lipid phosphate phosphohydrolase 1 [Culex quinquefasciatus]|eukprot:XP_001862633.1 lipid phosphate phosphohydrolase 1 [Culex quinquefasciatus]
MTKRATPSQMQISAQCNFIVRQVWVSIAERRRAMMTSTADGTRNDSRRILVRVGIDVAILCAVGLFMQIFLAVAEPVRRGFFCDDESLRYPFRESTVASWQLWWVIATGIPLAVIFVTERVRAEVKTVVEPLQFFRWQVPFWVVEAYKSVGMFGFGATCNHVLTNVGKYSVGRLRPHFFAVCQPVLPDGTSCLNKTLNYGRYIEDFTCSSRTATDHMLSELPLSFPSGHSSVAMYALVYCAIYLQVRLNWGRSGLLKHFLQFLLIALGWYTCLSRVADYKHFWSDVLAGGLLGTGTAVVVANDWSNLFKRRRSWKQRVNSGTQTSDENKRNGGRGRENPGYVP